MSPDKKSSQVAAEPVIKTLNKANILADENDLKSQ